MKSLFAAALLLCGSAQSFASPVAMTPALSNGYGIVLTDDAAEVCPPGSFAALIVKDHAVVHGILGCWLLPEDKDTVLIEWHNNANKETFTSEHDLSLFVRLLNAAL